MTLAHELEDLEARRKAGTLSDADAAVAKHALLSGAAGRGAPSERDGAARGLLIAGLFSNALWALVVLGMIAGAAYLFVPLVMAVPVMILCALALPVIWLWDWIGDFFG